MQILSSCWSAGWPHVLRKSLLTVLSPGFQCFAAQGPRRDPCCTASAPCSSPPSALVLSCLALSAGDDPHVFSVLVRGSGCAGRPPLRGTRAGARLIGDGRRMIMS